MILFLSIIDFTKLFEREAFMTQHSLNGNVLLGLGLGWKNMQTLLNILPNGYMYMSEMSLQFICHDDRLSEWFECKLDKGENCLTMHTCCNTNKEFCCRIKRSKAKAAERWVTHNSTQIDSAEVTWRIIISDNTLVWSSNVERKGIVSKRLCFSQTCFHNNFSNVSSFYDLVEQNNENASWKKFSWLFTSFTTRNWNRTHSGLQFKVSNIQVRDSGSLLLFDIQNYCLNDSLFSLLRIC